jgi:hypothetical protein
MNFVDLEIKKINFPEMNDPTKVIKYYKPVKFTSKDKFNSDLQPPNPKRRKVE